MRQRLTCALLLLLLQMRVGEVAGWDMQQANRYWWRPDYEGIELAQCRYGMESQ